MFLTIDIETIRELKAKFKWLVDISTDEINNLVLEWLESNFLDDEEVQLLQVLIIIEYVINENGNYIIRHKDE